MYYILKNKKVVECKDVLAWDAWNRFSENSRVDETVKGDVKVSTIFKGIHEGVFVTSIFGGDLDQRCYKSATWEEAKRNHRGACLAAFGAGPRTATKVIIFSLVLVLTAVAAYKFVVWAF